METTWISTVALIAALAATDPEPARQSIYESPADPTARGKIDELVFGQLKQLGIAPASLCSDGVFVRRVYLDVIGTLPTAEEARAFLEDRAPDKRSALIDRLLQREEFADYWAMKWSDLLRIKAEFPINLWPNAAQAYHRWIRSNIRRNVPCDRFVREMLTANGSNFRVPQVNFYRAMQNREPQGIVQAVALTFMGARAEKWPKERWSGMAAFFSQISYKSTGEWKEQIVFYNEAKARAQIGDKEAILPDGTRVRLFPERDPRAVFADWLVAPQNPWFARSIVNRVWSWLQGRGIVHEPDDIRPDNPPSNPELLAYLEQELVGSRYDLKHIYRLILNSATYQLSPIPRSDKPEALAHFAFYPLRRLEAEVLIDALCQITGTTEKYYSMIPEPYTYIPEDHRSISLPDGSITSSFLEQFGRPSRDTGLESERNNRLTGDQRLHLLNSSHIRDKIAQSPKLKSLLPPEPKTPPKPKPEVKKKDTKSAKPQSSRSGAKTEAASRQQAEAEAAASAHKEIVTKYYLAILSRFPTDEEWKLVAAYWPPRRGGMREGPTDLVWSLINSSEFLYRH
jgi:hypothetical protein